MIEKKNQPSCKKNEYKRGIFIHREWYDAAWLETLKKYPLPRNPELPRDLQSWHNFYRSFLESFPLLAKEEEFELITRWQRYGDIEARNHLIISLARIVGPIAGRMVSRRFPKLNGDGWLEAAHEMIACGNLGLIDAPSKLTLSRGFRLSTVANQWIRKYAHDGLASLVSVLYYPERKRELAKFDSQLASKSPGEDEDFEAFDSFGAPTNPELKLGYLQRQVGKRLFPWHDWGTYWPLLGDKGRFELPGGVSLEVPGSEHHELTTLLGWPIAREPLQQIEWNFLNEWVTGIFKPGPKPWRASRNPRDRYRPTNPGNAVVASDVIVDVCYLDNRQGSYSSWQQYAKSKPPDPEVIRLVEHVCTDMRFLERETAFCVNSAGECFPPYEIVRANSWRDAPERRQLDAYCHWDKHGNRIDKPTLMRRRQGCFGTLDWFAHTADGEPPDNWHINRHWRTTYPLAHEYLNRAHQRRLDNRAHRMFCEVERAAKMFNQLMKGKNVVTSKTERPLWRKAA